MASTENNRLFRDCEGNFVGEPTFLRTRYADPRDANLMLFGVVSVATPTLREPLLYVISEPCLQHLIIFSHFVSDLF